MTQLLIEGVIARQAALLAALDAADVAAIEVATAALSRALTALRADPAPAADASSERVGYALKQCDAARIRVNYLADRTRQRIDRLAARRGGRSSATYNSAGLFGS